MSNGGGASADGQWEFGGAGEPLPRANGNLTGGIGITGGTKDSGLQGSSSTMGTAPL